MPVRTKKEFMDELATQLQALSSISIATRLTKSVTGAELHSPYVGVVSINEVLQKNDGYNQRYQTQIGLFITTKEQDTAIEDIVDDIKDLIDTIDLGDNVYKVTYISEGIVATEDYISDDGDKYSTTRVDIEVTWNKSISSYPNPSSGLTEPIATAHYKVYALLSSGSYSSQPLGTLVYPSHTYADINIPAGSGSILVGVNQDPLIPQANYADEEIGYHAINMFVDIATDYVGGESNLNPAMKMVDNVVEKLCKNINLDSNYRIDTSSFNVIQIVNGLTESNTIGARISFDVNRYYDYEQE